ncbi:hypothetical protein E2562_021536 [Oryza meyeriana var. granulata]|uniref:Uncharacterized protein n=1 Tax=Oryza meyeriana var. granulata TaxID=110450 RepID=A0A6G1EXW7_9ORYZ|nr:hypothetical protein E2562_021536 [Oryza meyeriana var. granulata]
MVGTIRVDELQKEVEDLQAAKSKVEKEFKALKSFVKEKAILSSSQTLAVMKSLCPQVEIQAVDEGFAETCSEEQALALMDEAQGAATALVDNLEV